MIIIMATYSVLGDSLSTITQHSSVLWQDVLSLLAALFSALLVYVAWATLREHNRPYVSLFAETDKGGTIKLVLKNSGNRAAYNVNVSTDVPIESVFYAKNPEIKPPFVTEKTHPFIGPDQTVSGVFDYLSWRYDRRSENYKAPCDKYSVTIRYCHNKRRFVDKYQLDLSYLEFVPCGYSRDHLGDISDSLRTISSRLPNGFAHSLLNTLKYAPIKTQRNDKEQNGDNTIIAEDAENEAK